MTTPASPRHPFELLLEQLTGCMSRRGAPLRHGFGTQEDAAHTSADRVIWIPGDLDVAELPYQMPDADTPCRQTCTFDVSIYAGSPASVYLRHEELVGYIDLLIGPSHGAPPSQDGTRPHRPGYRIEKSKVEPRGGDGGAAGWGTIVPVVLFNPLHSMRLPRGLIESVTMQVVASDTDGAGAQVAVHRP